MSSAPYRSPTLLFCRPQALPPDSVWCWSTNGLDFHSGLTDPVATVLEALDNSFGRPRIWLGQSQPAKPPLHDWGDEFEAWLQELAAEDGEPPHRALRDTPSAHQRLRSRRLLATYRLPAPPRWHDRLQQVLEEWAQEDGGEWADGWAGSVDFDRDIADRFDQDVDAIFEAWLGDAAAGCDPFGTASMPTAPLDTALAPIVAEAIDCLFGQPCWFAVPVVEGPFWRADLALLVPSRCCSATSGMTGERQVGWPALVMGRGCRDACA